MCQRAVLLNLPKTQSLDIEFENIKYSVGTGFRKPKKTILKGVHGCFKSGELTAIMGPSGAGKSSLLSILTGMQRSGVTGSLRFRSKQGERDWNQYKKETCYIQQEDMLLPLFTVQEAMWIAADLKLGNNLSRKAKNMVIDDVLETLDLVKCREVRCNRLSGGQRKRLSIALELVDNPPVMFLDEPTTGLDSSASLQCVAMLQSLARGGRTIICTIHQPSATIYEMFDHVYFLAEGTCVYQGGAKNTVDFLKRYGLNCPKYHNPADYIIEVVSKEYGDFNDRLAIGATDESWRTTSPAKSILYHTDSVIKYSEEGKTTVLIERPSEYSKFLVLLHRSGVQLFRDWTVTHLKLLLHTLVGILLGLLYTDAGNDGSKTINNTCFMLVNIVYIGYTSTMPAVLKFPSELPVIRKEFFNNWYKLRTYFIAVMVTNIPIQVVFVLAYSVTSYYISSQPPELERFFKFLIVLTLVALIAEGIGLTLGTTCRPVNGTFLAAISLCVFLLFAGILVLFDHMPKFMYYVTFISYVRYAVEGLIHSLYGFDRPNLPCPSSLDELQYCHYRIPKVVLKELAMTNNNYWLDVVVLLIHAIALRVIAYCTLKRSVSSN